MKYKNALLISSVLFSLIFFSSQSFCENNDKEGAAEQALSEYEDICRLGKKIDDLPFYVYEDAGSVNNHFAPTGHMGDYTDLSINMFYKKNPQSGDSCIKITYNAKKSRGYKWTGLYWQDPPNNWGESFGGYDLSAATQLTFWARGEKGGEIIKVFQMGGIIGKYRDSGSRSLGPVTLTNKWKKYTINLRNMRKTMLRDCKEIGCCKSMQSLSRIIGGFCWASNIEVNHGGITFYLDEIRYEKN